MITALRESNSVFAVAPGATPLTGATTAAHPRGTVFSFQLDQAGVVKILIQASARGRRVGRRCVPDRRSLRHKRRCTRTVSIGTLTRSAHAGLNKLAFTGRIGGRALRPGHYVALFTATDAAGTSAARTLRFTIVRR
jgi:hypothetical protein